MTTTTTHVPAALESATPAVLTTALIRLTHKIHTIARSEGEEQADTYRQQRRLVLDEIHRRIPDPEPEVPDLVAMYVEAGDTEDGEHAEIVLVCPYEWEPQTFYEVDRSVRWNEIDYEGDPEGWPAISQGDDFYETTGYKCQGCKGDLDWIHCAELDPTYG